MAEPDYSYDELAQKDKQFVWHPFTQMQDYMAGDPMIIERGEGIKLIDVDGKEYWDSISSLWVNVHGHQVPEIDAAIKAQLDQVAHSTMLGHASVPAILLAEKLVQLTPASLQKVFYSDSGSEAVEIGLKIAYQYWRLKGEERRTFITMNDAYHGDTVGSVSVGGMDLFHDIYRDLLFPTLSVPYPHPFRYEGSLDECIRHCLRKLKDVLLKHQGEVIGIIVEPMVQGAAGMIMMPDGFMRAMADLAKQAGVLLLTDEVATGFGRTGRLFACEHEQVEPDILMTAKGLTGGYLPVAATLTTDAIYETFLGDYRDKKTFFHGHSYTGNQLGCAAALANINLFEKTDLIANVAEKTKALHKLLQPIAALPHVGDVRQKGFMVGIELMRDPLTMTDYAWDEQIGAKVGQRCRELGMLSRPLGNVVVFMPPLTSTEDELATMLRILQQAIEDVT